MQYKNDTLFNQVGKDTKKQAEANYTPYLHLANYSNTTLQPYSQNNHFKH